MLHSWGAENCEDTSATMVEKGTIWKKGRRYCVARAPNNASFKNNTHILGISIQAFPKNIAKVDALRSSTSRRFYSLMSSALCSLPASKTPVTNTYHLSIQGKITNEFSWKWWLGGLFLHRTRLFKILFGDFLIVVYFTRLRCTQTPCLFIWLHLA